GGAYVPLDPRYPPERLQYMLKDAQPSVLLTEEAIAARLPDTPTPIVKLDADWPRIEEESPLNLDAGMLGLRPGHLAYVIYTSGSTGQPKAVAIEHRQTVNLIFWAHETAHSEVFAETLQS